MKKIKLTLVAETPEDNMTVMVQEDERLTVEGKSISIHPVVIATYNPNDNLWHGYGKKFKEVVIK